MKKLKCVFGIAILLLVFCTACDKTDGLKRMLKGKYEIETYREVFIDKGCGGTGNYVNFKISNPGKIIFTNKRTIQGPNSSSTNKTYIGYFDYEYSFVDTQGKTHEQDERSVFQYEFQQHTGVIDTVKINFYDKTVRMDLTLEQDSDGNILAFKYQSYDGDCYLGAVEHIVK